MLVNLEKSGWPYFSIFFGPGRNNLKNRVFQNVDLAEIYIFLVLFLKTTLKNILKPPGAMFKLIFQTVTHFFTHIPKPLPAPPLPKPRSRPEISISGPIFSNDFVPDQQILKITPILKKVRFTIKNPDIYTYIYIYICVFSIYIPLYIYILYIEYI